MITDTLSDILIRIKNASMSGRPDLEFPYSKSVEGLVKVLSDKGVIASYKVFKDGENGRKGLNVTLCKEGEFVKVLEARRISKPGRRVYLGFKDIKDVKAGLGVLVISTPRGIMDASQARKRKLGGEALCEVFFRG